MVTLICYLISSEVCFRVYFLSKRCLNVTKWIIITVCDTSHHIWPKQSLFLCTAYLGYSYSYLTNGPHTDTQSSYTSMAPRWTNTHNAHISRTLIALDLIFFHLRWKTQHIKKGERDPFSSMKWKARVAVICQSKQRFNGGSDYWGIFSLRSLSNYMIEEGNVRRGRGWC